MKVAPQLFALLAAGCTFSGPSGDGNVGNPDANVGPDAFQADADLTIPFLEGFDRRRLVRIDNGGAPAASGAVFPIPIGPFMRAEMGPEGRDVCVTTFDNQVLAAQVEFSTEEAIVWVAANVEANTETKLWVYDESMNFDSGECEPGIPRPNPFSDFQAVFHFSDSWNSVDMGARNSAGGAEFDNNQNLDSETDNDVELALWATAVEFQNTEQFSTLEALEEFRVDPNETVIFEVLFKSPAANTSRVLFDTDNTSCQGMSLKLQASDLDEGHLGGSLGLGNNCGGGVMDFRATSQERLDDDQWHHAAFEIERNAVASQVSLYVDGVLVDSSGAFEDTGAISLRAMQVGRDVTSPDQDYAGLLDEVRIGPARSPEWIEVSARLLLDRSLMMVLDYELRP